MEAHHGAMEAQHGALEVYYSAMETHHGAVVSPWWPLALLYQIPLHNKLNRFKCRYPELSPALEDDQMM
jgi:hypothetical protein